MGETRREVREEATEHEMKGAGRETEGHVEEAAGKVTGDRSTEMKGKAKKAAGKIQKEAGRQTRDATD